MPFSSWNAVSPYATILVAAAVICAFCAVISWRRRAKAGGLPSAVSMGAAAIWALFYAFELATPGLEGKLVWAKLQYVGIAVLPVAWYLFALSYTGVVTRPRLRTLLAMSLIPAATVILVGSNGMHGLVWSRVALNVGGWFPDLMLDYGPWFWVSWTYSYLLLAGGSVLLVRGVWRYPGLYRQQAALVMLAAAAPWVANALYVTRILPSELDPTPLAFAFTASVLTLTMSRFRLLSVEPALVPTARHQLLVEIPDAVLVFDVHGRVVTANPAACSMLERSVSGLLGKTAPELFGDATAAQLDSGSSGVERRFEITCGDDEARRVYDVVASPVSRRHHGRGADIGRLLVFRDITERKLGEEALRKSEEQLIQSQKMETVGRLAGGVAHDFNNTLGVILGNVHLAMSQIDPREPVYADLEEIREAAERSAGITQQLLGFARKQVVTPKRIDLNTSMTAMLGMLRRLMGASVELVFKPGTDLGFVELDPSQLDQMLINLCVNSRDAIAGSGTVTIETAPIWLDEVFCASHKGCTPGEYSRLTVRDTGCGMAPDTLEHVFEPFFTTKETGKGTGLGMATVYGIVKQNKGYIAVESEPGRGTDVHIYLPRVPVATAAQAVAAVSGSASGGGEVVLVVEDDAQLLRLSGRILRGLGYRVLSAQSPGEALLIAEAHSGEIALVVTDVVMPGMSGWDLVERLVASRPSLKSLYVSGHVGESLAARAERRVSFLQKPFTPEQLADSVRATLRGYQKVA